VAGVVLVTPDVAPGLLIPTLLVTEDDTAMKVSLPATTWYEFLKCDGVSCVLVYILTRVGGILGDCILERKLRSV
jgi:hypothetical protein